MHKTLNEPTLNSILAQKTTQGAFRISESVKYAVLAIKNHSPITFIADENSINYKIIWESGVYEVHALTPRKSPSFCGLSSHRITDSFCLACAGFDIDDATSTTIFLRWIEWNYADMNLDIYDIPHLLDSSLSVKIMRVCDISGWNGKWGGRDAWTILEMLSQDLWCDMIMSVLMADEGEGNQERLVKAKENRWFLVYNWNKSIKFLTSDAKKKFEFIKQSEETPCSTYAKKIRDLGFGLFSKDDPSEIQRIKALLWTI